MAELEGASGGHLVQPLCSSRATKSQLPKLLVTFSKDEDSTTSLSKLCHCLVTIIVKKIEKTKLKQKRADIPHAPSITLKKIAEWLNFPFRQGPVFLLYRAEQGTFMYVSLWIHITTCARSWQSAG